MPDTPSDVHPAKSSEKKLRPMTSSVMGTLRLIELQLVAFIMVFSASGLVPLLDLIFPAMTTAYILALSKLVFPTHRETFSESPEIFKGTKWFKLYVLIGTTVGLFLPLAYVLGGYARGDDHAVKSVAPNLFLLSFQILTESIISGLSLFSPPVRALVPVMYTIRRIFITVDWIKDVWVNKKCPENANLPELVWYWFGRLLAAANLAYFSVNLFGFLIPRFVSRAFEIYFKQRTEAKMREDGRRLLRSDEKSD